MVANSPGLIAGSYVLHRLLVPRHPPIALSSLSHNKNYKDARVHYTVLKIRAGKPAHHHHYPRTTPLRGKTHPSEHHHQKFGESRPQPHTHTQTHTRGPGTDSDPEKSVHHSTTELRPDPSGPNSAPRRSTPPSTRSTHHPEGISSTSTHRHSCTSNGQCSTFRSTVAQEQSPWKQRIDNHTPQQGNGCQCSLERR